MSLILVVDDNDLIGRMLCGVIREAGHRCHCVGTKADALQLLAHGSHDLVVTDMLLPDGRGQEVVERAEQLGIGVITMSGHPDEIGHLRDAKPRHLEKPFRIEQFERMLRDTLAGP